MGILLSRYLFLAEKKQDYQDDSYVYNESYMEHEEDAFALINEFITTSPHVMDTFTVPTFMKYRILEDFAVFLRQREIKLYANYNNKS